MCNSVIVHEILLMMWMKKQNISNKKEFINFLFKLLLKIPNKKWAVRKNFHLFRAA